MLIWEILVTKLDMLHPVLVPALENIFSCSPRITGNGGQGILSSMELLLIGTAAGLGLGTLLGLICG